jgi:hypothetical protein
MSKTAKIILGIITILPFIFFAIYLSFIFQFVRELVLFRRTTPEDVFFQMWPAFIYIGLLVVAKIGLLVYYIIHAVNNKQIDSTERIVWVLVFIFAGMIGYPIYWYMRIWRDTPMGNGQLTIRKANGQ